MKSPDMGVYTMHHPSWSPPTCSRTSAGSPHVQKGGAAACSSFLGALATGQSGPETWWNS